jgi:hypothetical protein
MPRFVLTTDEAKLVEHYDYSFNTNLGVTFALLLLVLSCTQKLILATQNL